MMDVRVMPFQVMYNHHIRKKTIQVLLGAFVVILLYQTPSKIKYIQNDLKEILMDNDVIQRKGRGKPQDILNRRINVYNFG